LSSLNGRDWSCSKNIVSITALSGVGTVFSAGVAAVCAPAPELNAKMPASAAAASSDPNRRPIAISFFQTPDHCLQVLRMAIIAEKRWL
jgi:hypothetical protein